MINGTVTDYFKSTNGKHLIGNSKCLEMQLEVGNEPYLSQQ